MASACRNATTAKKTALQDYPPIILWAWERPEDLRFLDAKKFGAAFLAQTLVLQGGEVQKLPRRQPLEVAPETFLIAVTRIESDRRNRPAQTDAQRSRLVGLIKETLTLPNVRAVQLDYDAPVSERDFYRNLIRDLRAQLPENVSLTMTALASWCASDGDWLKDLPVDEVVPMAFRMGADDRRISAFLAAGEDWRAPLCRTSYGIALDEPLKMEFKPDRRVYIFNHRPWRGADVQRLPEGVLK